MDITDWLHDRCGKLRSRPNRKLVSTGVSLLDVMNSLEMGNVAMDTGMQATYSPFDPNTPLSSHDVCWIMDEMTHLEYAWWSGATLCQTVFTSMAYHNYERIDDYALRAYSIGYAKCIDLAYKELCRGHVNDGEDCWLDHFGISVTLADPVGNVIELLDEALARTTGGVADRLLHRKCVLALLHGSRTRLDLPSYVQPSALGASFFREVSGCVRQCMPLPPYTHASRDQVWGCLTEVYRDMEEIHEVSDWRLHLLGKSYRRQTLPIVRSMYKSALCPPRGCMGVNTRNLVQQWFMRHSGIDFRQLEGQGVALWRDQVHGCFVASLAIPLQNRARQYRSYMAMSFSWHERSLEAKRLFPEQLRVFDCLIAARLDCLLEAVLAAFDLELLTTEKSFMWWWLHQISSMRASFPLAKSWESTWAEAWSAISSTRITAETISRAHFEKRFKWALRGKPCPKYEDFGPVVPFSSEALAILAGNRLPGDYNATIRQLLNGSHRWLNLD